MFYSVKLNDLSYAYNTSHSCYSEVIVRVIYEGNLFPELYENEAKEVALVAYQD